MNMQRLPSYHIPASRLGMGSSLGNSSLWVNTKNTGDIERIFCVAAGKTLVGSFSVRYGLVGRPLWDFWPGREHDPSEKSYTPLDATEDVITFDIHPAYQRRRFILAAALSVRETVFLPLLARDKAQSDPPILYYLIDIENVSAREHNLRVIGSARLRGETTDDVMAEYDTSLQGLVAWNKDELEPTRILACSEKPVAYETSFDFGQVYNAALMRALSNSCAASGDILGALQVEFNLKAGERKLFSFKIGVYDGNADEARAAYQATTSGLDALDLTIANLEDVIHRGEVITPDPVINDGALWSKVNMRRVMARYPTGWLFTNDPGVSSNVVCRDCAWFVVGNDYFMPQFSRSLLDKWASLQYPSGKLPEFVNALTDQTEDDGLNINDDTPLYVMAADHYYRATGDLDWLRQIYPSLAKAGWHIVSQMDARDLVCCSANDPRGNVWAIASWRNIIPNYSINGAVTEINAECVAALRFLAYLAERIPSATDAQYFMNYSIRIRDAMAKHLVNPGNGMFYLNIGVEGDAHTDLTGDEVFPVMFRACDEETSFRIISRLNSSDFWTSAGLRTASNLDPRYDPAAFSGLIGGVWPGLTWWYAFAAAPSHPEFMVKALRSSFEHYAEDPRRYNTVPGQFSEWFDGESLVNRGMRLSPWEPPRFLWAAIEGVCGLTLTGDLPQIQPLVPADWRWLALRRVPYHGEEISYFAVRARNTFHLHTTCEIDSDHPHSVYTTDASDNIPIFSRSARVIAFQREHETILLVGNVTTTSINVPVDLSSLLTGETKYHVRIYNSERDDWETDAVVPREEVGSLTVTIESQGYRLMHFTRADE
jgi:Bacterial alpha-L-rhamnosidase 6 hairpin glycosidase domain